MKRISLLPCVVALALSACNSGQPLASGGDFDPFSAPGMNKGGVGVLAKNGMKKGSIVRTVMDNAAFFKKRPDGNADADKMLKANTEMKVISDDQSYVKVELNSGEVGYVPTVQVSNEKAQQQQLTPIPTYTPGAVQVYPPLPGTPLPSIKPVPDQPTLPPVIDPESPTPQLPPAVPDPAPAEKPAGQ
jgi:uncharacterized protein YgiM (DUF1202 family)